VGSDIGCWKEVVNAGRCARVDAGNAEPRKK
jgi:hypothetical protein